MDHAQHLPRAFPWRTATIVVGAIAAAELLALVGIGATHVAASLRPHAKAAAHVARTAPVAHRHVVMRVVAQPSRPLRARAHLSVLVLNGNGINGAAGREAGNLQVLGYGRSSSADAQRHDYARSMVLYLPGYAREARRLGHDTSIRLVAPVDGLRRAQLKGSQLVVVLGGS